MIQLLHETYTQNQSFLQKQSKNHHSQNQQNLYLSNYAHHRHLYSQKNQTFLLEGVQTHINTYKPQNYNIHSKTLNSLKNQEQNKNFKSNKINQQNYNVNITAQTTPTNTIKQMKNQKKHAVPFLNIIKLNEFATNNSCQHQKKIRGNQTQKFTSQIQNKDNNLSLFQQIIHNYKSKTRNSKRKQNRRTSEPTTTKINRKSIIRSDIAIQQNDFLIGINKLNNRNNQQQFLDDKAKNQIMTKVIKKIRNRKSLEYNKKKIKTNQQLQRHNSQSPPNTQNCNKQAPLICFNPKFEVPSSHNKGLKSHEYQELQKKKIQRMQNYYNNLVINYIKQNQAPNSSKYTKKNNNNNNSNGLKKHILVYRIDPLRQGNEVVQVRKGILEVIQKLSQAPKREENDDFFHSKIYGLEQKKQQVLQKNQINKRLAETIINQKPKTKQISQKQKQNKLQTEFIQYKIKNDKNIQKNKLVENHTINNKNQQNSNFLITQRISLIVQKSLIVQTSPTHYKLKNILSTDNSPKPNGVSKFRQNFRNKVHKHKQAVQFKINGWQNQEKKEEQQELLFNPIL